MSLLSNRKAYLPLEEGKPYKVKLTAMTEKPAENPTEILLGSVAFHWETEDHRPITDNRFVPRGTDILAQQLLVQLNKPELDGKSQEELFTLIQTEELECTLWVERVTTDTGWFTNYHFAEPRPKTTSSATAAPAQPLPEVPIV